MTSVDFYPRALLQLGSGAMRATMTARELGTVSTLKLSVEYDGERFDNTLFGRPSEFARFQRAAAAFNAVMAEDAPVAQAAE